jgi:hypothetical protein
MCRDPLRCASKAPATRSIKLTQISDTFSRSISASQLLRNVTGRKGHGRLISTNTVRTRACHLSLYLCGINLLS